MQVVDQISAKIVPTRLEAERDDIETTLATLAAEREEHRVAAGRLFYAQSDGRDAITEREMAKHHNRIAEIDTEVRRLRGRRRQLADLLRPEPEAKMALVNVPMSAELVRAIDDLEDARARRQRLIAERHEDLSEAAEKRLAAKIEEMENRIRDLRVKRAELLKPYNAAVADTLAPMIHAAASRLDQAAIAFTAALDELREIAAVLPPAGAGLGNGLEPVAAINTQPAAAARILAATLIAANPGVEARCAA